MTKYKKTKTGNQKASDYDLVSTYIKTESIHKTAKIFNMCFQSVHERLKRLKVNMNGNGVSWTKNDDNDLLSFYSKGFNSGDGKLKKFCTEKCRTAAFISKQAKRLGLSNKKRNKSVEVKKNTSVSSKKWHSENNHPKGFLGHKHTNTSKEKISKSSIERLSNVSEEDTAKRIMKMMKTKHRNGTMTPARQKTTWKQGWRTIGGIRKYYRSRWEANYARYLEFLKKNKHIKKWEHEPETFWFEGVKRGTVSYLPDFRIVNNDDSTSYHEVKGWWDAKSKTKIKRMKKYHPNVNLIIIDTKPYNELEKKVGSIISGWEFINK